MTRVGLVLGFVFLLGRLAMAAPLEFRAVPGGGVLEDTASGKVLARSQPGQVGVFQLDLPAEPHRLRIELAPYDPLDLDLTVDRGRWRVRTTTRDALLNAMTMLPLSRTIRLNLEPAGTTVWADSPAGQVLNVAGMDRHVVPVPQRNGRFTIPDAANPPTLFLTHPRFEPRILQIPAAALADPTDVYPPQTLHLHPSYGPFSYGTFDIALAVALLALVTVYLRVVQPRRRQRDQDLELLREILETRSEAARPALASVASALEKPLRADSGKTYLAARVIGRGGMGAVFEGLSLESGAREAVAIKILFSAYGTDAALRVRFRREVSICQKLHHPAIVKVLDWGDWAVSGEEIPFMVMELVHGQTLGHLIEGQPPLAVPQALTWLGELLSGLQAAHGNGIVHRDLKPDNLMITRREHLKIMDFGIARDATLATVTTAHSQLGTPLYMSPEHFQANSVVPASDIYSVGLIAYEMLTGRLPHDETDPWAILGVMLSTDYPDPRTFRPDVPPALAAFVMRMLAREPGQRFADAGEALRALQALVTNL